MSLGLASTIVITEEDPQVVGLPNIPTAVAGSVGVCQRGAVGVAKLSTTFSEWVRNFGGFVSYGDAAIAAMGFFLQVSQGVYWQVRTVHYSGGAKTSSQSTIDIPNGDTAAVGKGRVFSRKRGPYKLADSDTLVFVIDAGAQANQSVTFTASAAAMESGSAENFDVSTNDTLSISVNGGSVKTHQFVGADFPGGSPTNAVTAEDMAAAINANFPGIKATVTSGGTKVTLTSDRKGNTSAITVSGTANTALGFAASASGAGNLANADSVTAAQLKTLIEASTSFIEVSDVDGQVKFERSEGGSTKSIQVDVSSTADDSSKLFLDNDVHTGQDGAVTYGTVEGTIDGPWELADGDNLQVKVDGGGAQTATFSGTAATLECATAETYDFSGGKTLTLKLDEGDTQTITFVDGDFAVPAAATADEVAAVINAQLTGGKAKVTSAGTKVTIDSDTKGLSSAVQIIGGDANAELGFTTGLVKGTGNVQSLAAITFYEVKELVEAAASGVVVEANGAKVNIVRVDPGSTKTVQVDAASSAETVFGFPTTVQAGSSGAAQDTLRFLGADDGDYPSGMSVIISDATSGVPAEFNATFKQGNAVVEFYANLTMDNAATRFVEDVLADPTTPSPLFRALDLAATGDALARRPANGTYSVWTVPANANGLTGLTDTDFVGNSSDGNGLYALDVVANLTIVTIPGQASAAVHLGMVTYCETQRKGLCFAILDPPASLTATQMVDYVENTAALLNLTDKAAIYWPRIKTTNPNKDVFGNENSIVVAPSGFIAGVYARNDRRPGGVYEAPAGVENGIIRGCVGFETNEVLKETVRDIIYPKLINPITKVEGFSRCIDGSRTLRETSPFPTIGERRGVIFIEKTLEIGLQFIRHKNNTKKLRMRAQRTTTAFLLIQLRLEAFRETDPKKAFSVDFGDALNPPTEQFARRMNGRIALATAKPVDYVVLKFAQDQRALLEELAEAVG